jgi:hypothetical protein
MAVAGAIVAGIARPMAAAALSNSWGHALPVGLNAIPEVSLPPLLR